MFAASPAFAATCFDLSADGKTWAANAPTLCVEPNTDGESEYKLTLSRDKKTVAVYFLNSLPSAALAFGVSAKESSLLDESVTIFIGHGEVMIGSKKYFYKE